MNAQGPETGLKAGGAATVVVGVADVVVLAAAGVAPVSGVVAAAVCAILVNSLSRSFNENINIMHSY